ncbi:hypothetical protein Leryth_022164 [Lithospermum erythrorhizon]|nr:hypothetical protein Leryth_022164 [Lithospermum erythrorhizon]
MLTCNLSYIRSFSHQINNPLPRFLVSSSCGYILEEIVKTMARFIAFLVLCLLPAIVSAGPFYLTGKCYCDTCRVGYETEASIYLSEREQPKTQKLGNTASRSSSLQPTYNYITMIHKGTILTPQEDFGCSS